MTSPASLRIALRGSLAALAVGAVTLAPSVAPASPPSGLTLTPLGEEGAGGGEIPGNSVLIFRIELIDVLPAPGRIQQG